MRIASANGHGITGCINRIDEPFNVNREAGFTSPFPNLRLHSADGKLYPTTGTPSTVEELYQAAKVTGSEKYDGLILTSDRLPKDVLHLLELVDELGPTQQAFGAVIFSPSVQVLSSACYVGHGSEAPPHWISTSGLTIPRGTGSEPFHNLNFVALPLQDVGRDPKPSTPHFLASALFHEVGHAEILKWIAEGNFQGFPKEYFEVPIFHELMALTRQYMRTEELISVLQDRVPTSPGRDELIGIFHSVGSQYGQTHQWCRERNMAV